MPFDTIPAPGTLPRAHLVLAVHDCVRARRTVEKTIEALPREDPDEVALIYAQVVTVNGYRMADPGVPAGRRMRKTHPQRKLGKRGLGVADAAARLGIPQDAFRGLCDHHGILELAPYGGQQQRRLVSDKAMAAGLGWNSDPSGVRSARLDGFSKSVVFPVFDTDRLSDLGWILDWEGIKAKVAELATKEARVAFLLEGFPELTDKAVGELAGVSRAGVQRRRAASK